MYVHVCNSSSAPVILNNGLSLGFWFFTGTGICLTTCWLAIALQKGINGIQYHENGVCTEFSISTHPSKCKVSVQVNTVAWWWWWYSSSVFPPHSIVCPCVLKDWKYLLNNIFYTVYTSWQYILLFWLYKVYGTGHVKQHRNWLCKH